MKLSEDDLYRQSTQLRLWSFTPQQIADQRQQTNRQATERVKANVARIRAQRLLDAENDAAASGVESGSGANTPNAVTSDREVDCLTSDEELKIVNEFCERAIKLGDFFKFPFEVTVCSRPCLPSYSCSSTLYRPHVSSSCADSISSTRP